MDFIHPGRRSSGVVQWTSTRNGVSDQIGSVLLALDLRSADPGRAIIEARVDGELFRQEIALEWEPCRYGGRRLFFRCPISGRRCMKLAFAQGIWASRQALGLTYETQSADRLQRLGLRRARAEDKLFGLHGHRQPRGARRARLLNEWINAEMILDRSIESEISRRFARLS